MRNLFYFCVQFVFAIIYNRRLFRNYEIISRSSIMQSIYFNPKRLKL